MKTYAYKSINGGASWFQTSESVNISGAADQGWYDLCIAINPLDPYNVFIGNMELSRSVDGSAFTFAHYEGVVRSITKMLTPLKSRTI